MKRIEGYIFPMMCIWLIGSLLPGHIAAQSAPQHIEHKPQEKKDAPPDKSKKTEPENMKMNDMDMKDAPKAKDSHASHGGMQMPSMDLNELVNKAESNVLPKLGGIATTDQAPIYKFEQLEEMALKANPTLRQAQAEIQAANGRKTQAGLWPNPTVGYSGEEISGGSSRGGQQGGFIEQRFVLGGKLALSRKVAGQDVKIAEIESEEQQLRVRNAVRLTGYRVLAAQEQLAVAREAVTLSEQSLETSHRLRNTGMADDSEVVQTEIEVRQAELNVRILEHQLTRWWRTLAAVIGDPTLPQGKLDAKLDEIPAALNENEVFESLALSSPAVRIAQVSIERAEASLARTRREPVPDVVVRAGMRQNRELREPANKPIGVQSFAEVGVQIPLFNRNQGNIEAGRAELERAHSELQRVQLALRERASIFVQNYADARAMVAEYQEHILPSSKRIYEMQLKAWGQMATSYPQVLTAQHRLFLMQKNYIEALQGLHTNAIALKGYLLVDGLEAPSRPGEVDMPVRELNLPMGNGGKEQQ